MHISWESFTGYIDAQGSSGNVISNNTFTHSPAYSYRNPIPTFGSLSGWMQL